jgi:uncharacterized membrane protein
MEAFSDGVIAIIITIMVLELRVPHDTGWRALVPTLPVFLSYLMSFVYIGIYWNNHHHLLQAAQHVNGGILWANLHLLFWLSLVPFATAWLGENKFAAEPAALYGAILFMAGVAYLILARSLIALHGPESMIATALGADFKGKISAVIYLIAIPLALFRPRLTCVLYVLVALMWLIPDRRLERTIAQE